MRELMRQLSCAYGVTLPVAAFGVDAVVQLG
jgi:hypothetical protein